MAIHSCFYMAIHVVVSDQTRSSSGQDHKTCSGDSGTALHQSQRGQLIIVCHTRLDFLSIKFRQSLHINFLTLFGELRDQIPFQRFFLASRGFTWRSITASTWRSM